MDTEFLVQMRQSNKCGSVKNDEIFNLLLGSGAGPWASISCVMQDTRHIYWFHPPKQLRRKKQKWCNQHWPSFKVICNCHWWDGDCTYFRNKGVTFNTFAEKLPKYGLTTSSGARRTDITFYVYCKTLIKNAESSHRKVKKLYFEKIIMKSIIHETIKILSIK